MIRILSLFVISLLIFNSCNNPDSQTNQSNKSSTIASQNDIEPQGNEDEMERIVIERDVLEERSKAISEIQNNSINSTKAFQFLTINYYIVDFIADGSGAPKDVIDMGEWYKFNEDFTYQHGFFSKIEDEGKYIFTEDKPTLLMLPNNEGQFPSEWRVMYSGDIIILAGTTKFGNNAYQKHMQNIKEQPKIVK